VRSNRLALASALVLTIVMAGTVSAGRATIPSSSAVTPDIPSDTQLFADDFESGSLSNWTVTTAVNGTARVDSVVGHTGATTQVAHLTVPDYSNGSIAYMKRTLASPVYALSASGWFDVLSGGCDSSAGYSAGNVPFLRFFDTAGRRVVGLYRINGACNSNTKIYVQHSGSFFRVNKNQAFGKWVKWELRATVNGDQSLVEVYMNDGLVYSDTVANNGIVPFASVNVHNEHTNQVGDLLADDIRLATFDTAPPSNPCDATTPTPTNADPGTVVLADNFESFNLNMWTATGVSGDGTAAVTTTAAKTGNCGALLHVTSSTSSRAYLNKVLPSGTSEVWLDGWFNVKAEGGSGSNVPYWRLFDSSGNRLVDVYRTNVAGALYLRLPNGSGGYAYTSLGRTVALNTWHEIKLHIAAGTGTVEIWYDGTQVGGTLTGKPIGSTYASAQIGAEHFAQQGDLAVDDVVVKRVP
jgi:hypothetical protein